VSHKKRATLFSVIHDWYFLSAIVTPCVPVKAVMIALHVFIAWWRYNCAASRVTKFYSLLELLFKINLLRFQDKISINNLCECQRFRARILIKNFSVNTGKTNSGPLSTKDANNRFGRMHFSKRSAMVGHGRLELHRISALTVLWRAMWRSYGVIVTPLHKYNCSV